MSAQDTFNPFFTPYKEAFDLWEKYNAQYWEGALRSPLFLETLGKGLELSLGSQRAFLQMTEEMLGSWGQATRSQQELALHKLNQLETQVKQLARQKE